MLLPIFTVPVHGKFGCHWILPCGCWVLSLCNSTVLYMVNATLICDETCHGSSPTYKTNKTGSKQVMFSIMQKLQHMKEQTWENKLL